MYLYEDQKLVCLRFSSFLWKGAPSTKENRICGSVNEYESSQNMQNDTAKVVLVVLKYQCVRVIKYLGLNVEQKSTNENINGMKIKMEISLWTGCDKNGKHKSNFSISTCMKLYKLYRMDKIKIK